MAKNKNAANENFNFKGNEGMKKVENEALVCKDCNFRTEEVATCKIYQDIKPGKVIYGGKCEAYEKE